MERRIVKVRIPGRILTHDVLIECSEEEWQKISTREMVELGFDASKAGLEIRLNSARELGIETLREHRIFDFSPSRIGQIVAAYEGIEEEVEIAKEDARVAGFPYLEKAQIRADLYLAAALVLHVDCVLSDIAGGQEDPWYLVPICMGIAVTYEFLATARQVNSNSALGRKQREVKVGTRRAAVAELLKDGVNQAAEIHKRLRPQFSVSLKTINRDLTALGNVSRGHGERKKNGSTRQTLTKGS